MHRRAARLGGPTIRIGGLATPVKVVEGAAFKLRHRARFPRQAPPRGWASYQDMPVTWPPGEVTLLLCDGQIVRFRRRTRRDTPSIPGCASAGEALGAQGPQSPGGGNLGTRRSRCATTEGHHSRRRRGLDYMRYRSRAMPRNREGTRAACVRRAARRNWSPRSSAKKHRQSRRHHRRRAMWSWWPAANLGVEMG